MHYIKNVCARENAAIFCVGEQCVVSCLQSEEKHFVGFKLKSSHTVNY